MMEFYDWVPRTRTTAEQWLWQQFHDDDRFRPLIWDPDVPLESPRYVEDSEDDCSGSSDSAISTGATKE